MVKAAEPPQGLLGQARPLARLAEQRAGATAKNAFRDAQLKIELATPRAQIILDLRRDSARTGYRETVGVFFFTAPQSPLL